MALVEYEVEIGGVKHKLLLDDTEAATRNTRFFATPFGAGSTAPPNVSAEKVNAVAPDSPYPRAILDGSDGRLYLGNGTTAPDGFLQGNLSSLRFGTSALTPATPGKTDLGLVSHRFRWARLSQGVQVGSFTTDSRPPASTAGVGCMVFDSTLNKPIWSTGTEWVDASGTVV